jgi:hypothetical protein
MGASNTLSSPIKLKLNQELYESPSLTLQLIQINFLCSNQFFSISCEDFEIPNLDWWPWTMSQHFMYLDKKSCIMRTKWANNFLANSKSAWPQQKTHKQTTPVYNAQGQEHTPCPTSNLLFLGEVIWTLSLISVAFADVLHHVFIQMFCVFG